MIPDLPKWTPPSTPILSTHVPPLNDVHSSWIAERTNSPGSHSSENQPSAPKPEVKTKASAVYAVINHRQSSKPAGKQHTVTHQVKNPEYAVINVSWAFAFWTGRVQVKWWKKCILIRGDRSQALNHAGKVNGGNLWLHVCAVCAIKLSWLDERQWRHCYTFRFAPHKALDKYITSAQIYWILIIETFDWFFTKGLQSLKNNFKYSIIPSLCMNLETLCCLKCL